MRFFAKCDKEFNWNGLPLKCDRYWWHLGKCSQQLTQKTLMKIMKDALEVLADPFKNLP